MKRILQVFDSLEISGGVQGVVMNVYRRIDRTRVQFDFAVYDAPEKNSYQPEIEALGGRVIPVKNLSAAGIAGFYRQFARLLKASSYDAVHAHNIHHNGLILLAAKNAGVPIRISHGHQGFDERNESFARKALASVLKALNNRVATRKVACSDLAGYFLYGKKARFEFLPNAIDLRRYAEKRDRIALRHQYGFMDDEQRLIVHIGRFSPPKKQLFLSEIMVHLRNENCKLLIAGDGPLKDEVLGRFKRDGVSGQVIYLGLREDVPELLSLADCMVLPSIYEGLPLVAVEAQAAGCYSLISDRVTKMADLGLGLVEYLGIEYADEWADRIRQIRSIRPDVPHETILARLRALRFDAETNLQAWYDLYGAG